MTRPNIQETDDGLTTVEYVVQDNELERYKQRKFCTESSDISRDEGICLIDWMSWLTRQKNKREKIITNSSWKAELLKAEEFNHEIECDQMNSRGTLYLNHSQSLNNDFNKPKIF